MNTTRRKGLDTWKVMYISWINKDFLRKFGVLKQKSDCLKFLAYLCVSLLLLQDFECNSFIYFRFKVFETEIQPLERVEQFCLSLMWWTSKHLSVWGNFWPDLELLKTQSFNECFDTIQLKS